MSLPPKERRTVPTGGSTSPSGYLTPAKLLAMTAIDLL
jgi:hypothetical protein